MARRPLHESYTQVTQKSTRWIQASYDNNNIVKGETKSNGSTSDNSDFFEKEYKSSLHNRFMNLLAALWSYMTFGNKELDTMMTPKRFPVTAAEGLGISWYTLPTYWLYKFCTFIHLYDVWLLSLLHAPHSSRTQSKNNRITMLALFLLFLPFIVFAGLILANCCSFSNCMTQLQNSVKWESTLFSPVEF